MAKSRQLPDLDDLAAALRAQALSAPAVLVASDGGAKGRALGQRCSSWGIAVEGGFTLEGTIAGLDTSPAFAEKWASYLVALAAAEAGVHVRLFSDNAACVSGWQQLENGTQRRRRRCR